MFDIDDNFLASVGYDVDSLSEEQKDQYKSEIMEELHARTAEALSSNLDETQVDDFASIQDSAERAKSWLYEFHSDFEQSDDYQALVRALGEQEAQVFYAGALWLRHAVPGYGQKMQEIMEDYQEELIEKRAMVNKALGI